MTTSTVFNMAMALIDEIDTTTFVPNEVDTIDYKSRTLLLMNILANELYPYSSNYTAGAILTITDFDTDIDLDENIVVKCLPYGLAAKLLLGEDNSIANFFEQKYNEAKALLSIGMASGSTDIVDVYGGGSDPLGFSGGGRWN